MRWRGFEGFASVEFRRPISGMEAVAELAFTDDVPYPRNFSREKITTRGTYVSVREEECWS